MEQSLSMNLSQRLAMTMQLQQAIQILQLSAQDLRAMIEKEYLENPALEMEYGDARAGDKLTDRYQMEDISALAVYLDGDNKQPKYFLEDKATGMEAAASVDITLEDELLEQAGFAFSSEHEREIAVFIIGCIDGRGYLMTPVEEIMRVTRSTEEETLKVLKRVQEFEPSGVGARNLQECLRIQAKAQGIYHGLVALLIDRYLDDIADARIKAIAEAEHMTPENVQMAVDILRTLNPKPGCAYGGASSQYITPDVLVQEVDGKYVVSINDNYVPELHISAMYRNAAGFDEDTQKYIGQRLNAAAWLIKSIEQRRQTILHVVEEIVRKQTECIKKGMGHLHPMTMKQVADAIEVHESTVSRAVANKYVELPWGIVALKKFFTANLAAGNSDEAFIAEQVKSAIAEMIKAENPQKPLSDAKLADMLAEKNMKVSRRTVMKYREQMGYPSSVKRKHY